MYPLVKAFTMCKTANIPGQVQLVCSLLLMQVVHLGVLQTPRMRTSRCRPANHIAPVMPVSRINH